MEPPLIQQALRVLFVCLSFVGVLITSSVILGFLFRDSENDTPKSMSKILWHVDKKEDKKK